MSDRREARRQRLLKERNAAQKAASKRAPSRRGAARRDASRQEVEPGPVSPRAQQTRQGQQAAARTRAQRLKIPEHALSALELQAHRLYRRWRLDRAEALARRVLYLDPGRARAWWVIGDVAMRRGRWEQALDGFKRAISKAPSESFLWCRGAEALFYLGQYALSEQWFGKAMQLDASGARGAAQRAHAFLSRHARTFERARRRAASTRTGRASPSTRDAGRSEGENQTQALSEDALKAALAERAAANALEDGSSRSSKGPSKRFSGRRSH